MDNSSDGIDQLVSALWKEVLGKEVSSSDVSFFDVGGDSFLATLVVGGLAEELGIDLSVSDMYDHPTIRGLSVHLRDRVSG